MVLTFTFLSQYEKAQTEIKKMLKHIYGQYLITLMKLSAGSPTLLLSWQHCFSSCTALRKCLNYFVHSKIVALNRRWIIYIKCRFIFKIQQWKGQNRGDKPLHSPYYRLWTSGHTSCSTGAAKKVWHYQN